MSLWELAIVLIVALVVIGPKRLPQLARTTGVLLAKFRNMATNVKDELDKQVNLQENILKAEQAEKKQPHKDTEKAHDVSGT